MRSLRPSWCVFVLALLALAPAARAQSKPAVAILYFDYDGSSEEMGFLRKGLTQMLVTDLSGNPAVAPRVEIVERTRLQDVLAELELERTKKIDPRTANRIGKLLGARYLVMGGYFDIGGTLRVDARLVEVETGKVVASMGKHGKAEAFLALEQHLAGELATTLGKLKPVAIKGRKGKGRRGNKGKRGGVGGSKRKPKPPSSLDARQAAAYGKALDAIDRGDTDSARTILKDIVARQPDFEMASLDLSALAR